MSAKPPNFLAIMRYRVELLTNCLHEVGQDAILQSWLKELLPLSSLLGLGERRTEEDSHTVTETEDAREKNCLVDAA